MNRRVFVETLTRSCVTVPLPAETQCRRRRRHPPWQWALFTAMPFLVFVLHAALFGAWIYDDAGISFAYARNLAAGHGLVSQAGMVPVEGYSNPLWVLLMSTLMRLGLFHVVWTPKVVAALLTAASYAIVTTTLRRISGWNAGVTAGALTLTSLQPGFVIWSISGLENSLYVFLLCLLVPGMIVLVSDSRPPRRTAALTGILVAGLLTTRPDGAIYLALVPMVVLARLCISRRLQPWLGLFTVHAVVVTILVGVFLGFRWLYFHDLFPNTYYMKGGPTLQGVTSLVWLSPDTILKIRGLVQAVAGDRGATWLLVAILAGSSVLVGARRFHPILLLLALFSVFSTVAYILLPPERLEYRFASPFFLFFYVYLMAVTWSVCAIVTRGAAIRWLFATVLALFVLGTVDQGVKRSIAFASYPAVPLKEVAESYGHRYNLVAEFLGLKTASLLAPDLGGTLLYSNLTVYDLGGLCDRTIARTIGKHQKAFYDYVFSQVRPSFIHVHPHWVDLANLDADIRFRADYVAIREDVSYERSGKRLVSGDFIRRELLHGRLEPLAALLVGEIDTSLDVGPHCCSWIR